MLSSGVATLLGDTEYETFVRGRSPGMERLDEAKRYDVIGPVLRADHALLVQLETATCRVRPCR